PVERDEPGENHSPDWKRPGANRHSLLHGPLHKCLGFRKCAQQDLCAYPRLLEGAIPASCHEFQGVVKPFCRTRIMVPGNSSAVNWSADILVRAMFDNQLLRTRMSALRVSLTSSSRDAGAVCGTQKCPSDGAGRNALCG